MVAKGVPLTPATFSTLIAAAVQVLLSRLPVPPWAPEALGRVAERSEGLVEKLAPRAHAQRALERRTAMGLERPCLSS